MRWIFTIHLLLCKILFYFFQFDPQTLFLDDQVLFKERLISNSYERVRLEGGEPK
jgi:hypothetical protein